MRRRTAPRAPLGPFAFTTACLAVMAVAAAVVTQHGLLANAAQALTGVGGASLLATGLLGSLRP